jgi:hypothetical protein
MSKEKQKRIDNFYASYKTQTITELKEIKIYDYLPGIIKIVYNKGDKAKQLFVDSRLKLLLLVPNQLISISSFKYEAQDCIAKLSINEKVAMELEIKSAETEHIFSICNPIQLYDGNDIGSQLYGSTDPLNIGTMVSGYHFNN